MSLAVDLPWPNRVLHPNARPHYMAKAKAVKKARADAASMATAAGLRGMSAEAVVATITFSPPTNHAHDIDGLLSSVKAYIDGLADVIGIDDSHWDIVPVKAAMRPLGNVRFEIAPMETA